MRNDLIIDFETFGLNQSTCPIINMSAFAFEWERFKVEPYTFMELVEGAKTFKVSVKDQTKNYNYVPEKETVQFWQDQPDNVRKQVIPTKNDLTLVDFCDSFLEYLLKAPDISYWWSRNNGYDPIILWTAYRNTDKKHSLDQYLPFWKLRDTKTYIDAKFDFENKNSFIPITDEVYWKENFQMHNSKHDIAADIMRLQTIYRAENDMEIPSK